MMKYVYRLQGKLLPLLTPYYKIKWFLIDAYVSIKYGLSQSQLAEIHHEYSDASSYWDYSYDFEDVYPTFESYVKEYIRLS
jgi:hypothetical protein